VEGGGARGRAAWAVARRDARRTASPNAGWPMAAMAGALGVELEKAGHYRLNAGGAAPTAETVARADRLLTLAAAGAAGLTLVLRWGCVHKFASSNGQRRQGSRARTGKAR
ncbi:MAG: cobalamin biosynthesis protein, partial [Chloroflexota bacterium]|nr:cobalamin biosynthesis protein [Chloroflexota bacterium]